jgi:hypothetical protein
LLKDPDVITTYINKKLNRLRITPVSFLVYNTYVKYQLSKLSMPKGKDVIVFFYFFLIYKERKKKIYI